MCKHDIPAFNAEDFDPVETGQTDPPVDPWDHNFGEPVLCPTCDSESEHLGSFGAYDVYRCQGCGLNFGERAW